MSVQLGAFVLEQPVGAGGMGVVWRARHADGVRVAIKVPTAEGATDARFVSAFHDEVRAVAALDHPSIVRLYDHGVVPATASTERGDVLARDLPWLAMEWASGGTLGSQPWPTSWAEVSSTLSALLRALAHVHAHGIVHRDLKPENVLVCTEADASPGLRLSDFGIVLGAGARARLAGGTPAYMAPEQQHGLIHLQGPWSDLFSLGVIAWRLLARRLPFTGTSRTAPPALAAAVPTPEGLEAWLAALLAYDPTRRFRRAADALAALESLGDATVPPDPAAASLSGEPGTDPQSPRAPQEETTQLASASRGPLGADGLGGYPRMLRTRPAPSREWREARPASRSSLLHGGIALANVGLGLVHLRPVPLAGRVVERDALWEALTEVVSSARPRAIVVSGAAGLGKTRLAEWLSVRAAELGIADGLAATHAPVAEADHGIVAMLARALRVEGLRGSLLEESLEISLADLPPHDRDAVASLLAGEPSRAPERARGRDRRALVMRALSALARERPLVIVIDDAQWAEEGIELASDALTALDDAGADEGRMLFVLSVRDDALAERSVEEASLARLLLHPRAARAPLAPLDAAEHGALVRHLLGLDPAVAVAIEQRTSGNPAFAVELVIDWLRRGCLQPGPEGLRLVGPMPELPADLRTAWSVRVERVLASRPDSDARAVRVAAVLGDRVDDAVWARALAASDIAPLPDLVAALAEEGLARRHGDAWSFVHGMLREAIVGSASAAELCTAHAACVVALAGVEGAERARGRHALAAGRAEEALDELLRAVDALDARGDYPAARAALDDAELAVAHAALAIDDARRGEVALRRVSAHKHLGRFEDALRVGDALLADIARAGWRHLDAPLRVQLADVHRLSGALLAAIALLDSAQVSATLAGQPISGVLRRRAQALIDAGRLTAARDALAQLTADPAAPAHERVTALRLSSVIARLEGRPDEAVKSLRDALERAEGLRWETAECTNQLGDALRALGDLPAAERCYRDALGRFRALASGDAAVVELNLSLVLIARERWHEVRAQSERMAAHFARHKRLPLLAAALCVGLPARAATGEWARFDAEADEALALLARTGFVEKDLVWLFDRAAKACEEAGDAARAERMRGAAEAQRAALRR